MEKRESNYESMKKQMQAKFISFDLSGIAREWELEEKDGCLLLTFAGQVYRIDRETGAVLYEEQGTVREADFNVSMTLFDILTRKRQHASGELLPPGALSAVHSATVVDGGLFRRISERFDGRDRALAAACERLGGVPYGKGDAGYLLPVFRDLKVAVQFWNSDDEFGPELSLLCSRNILDFMHYETMMYMLVHMTERLCELMDEAE